MFILYLFILPVTGLSVFEIELLGKEARVKCKYSRPTKNSFFCNFIKYYCGCSLCYQCSNDVEFKLAKFLQLIGSIRKTIFKKVRTETVLKL